MVTLDAGIGRKLESVVWTTECNPLPRTPSTMKTEVLRVQGNQYIRDYMMNDRARGANMPMTPHLNS